MTNLLKQRLTYLLIGLLVLMIAVISGFYYFDKIVSRPLEIKDIKIDTHAALKLNVLHKISKKNGIKEWELKAASATLLKNSHQAVLSDVSITFFTKEAKKVLLKAEKGFLNTKSHDMLLSDSVVVTYENSILRTDKLHYNKKKHMIYSDSPVKLTREGSHIEADSMTTRLDERRTVLKGNVKGRFSENFNIM